uniref:Uncharacterized protein n=1 Tax=viral metagenome TaxID=1070528 RepID=A0A6C0EFF1_9ZZZZ
MSLLLHPTSIYKQFLINQLNNQNPTTPTPTPNLPKELCDIIKSYCFYDTVSYQILCNIIRYKVDICDIINEHVINNEQLFIDYFEDDYEETPHNLDHATVIYTIQKYNPLENTFYFSMSNVIDLCKKCGNYVSCKTPNIPSHVRCTCF